MQEMLMIKKRIRKKRRRRRIIITLALTITILIVSWLPIFKIARIDVKGTADGQIIGYTNSLQNKNIWWHSLSSIEKHLTDFPTIKTAIVKRHFPNILEIDLKERQKTAFAFVANKFVIISEDGKVLEVADSASANLIEIKGLKSTNIKIGESFTEIGTDRYNKYICIISNFSDYGFLQGIKYIDLSANSTAIIKYNNSIIDFGKADLAESKMKLLNEIIKTSSKDTKAEIDVSNGKKAYYKETY